ncbi:hypothetical protein R1flu_015135 [Riccia fluitans]|uniref:Uncharacterized protein n=1 Tax=Riccia fluitans TaxID=41844 RepID=A0ABD1YJ70_9MARC
MKPGSCGGRLGFRTYKRRSANECQEKLPSTLRYRREVGAKSKELRPKSFLLRNYPKTERWKKYRMMQTAGVLMCPQLPKYLRPPHSPNPRR